MWAIAVAFNDLKLLSEILKHSKHAHQTPMNEGLTLSLFIAGVLFQTDSNSASVRGRYLSSELPIILKKILIICFSAQIQEKSKN